MPNGDLLNTLNQIVSISLEGMRPTSMLHNTITTPKQRDEIVERDEKLICGVCGSEDIRACEHCVELYCGKCHDEWHPYCSRSCQDEEMGGAL